MVVDKLPAVQENPDQVLVGIAQGFRITVGRRDVLCCKLKVRGRGGPGVGPQVELLDPFLVGEGAVSEKQGDPGERRGELRAGFLGIHQLNRLRETESGSSLAFAGAGHVGTAEDREEVEFPGKLVIRKLDGAGARRLSPEGIAPVSQLVDRIGEYFGLESSGVESCVVLLIILVVLIWYAAQLVGLAVAYQPDERFEIEFALDDVLLERAEKSRVRGGVGDTHVVLRIH